MKCNPPLSNPQVSGSSPDAPSNLSKSYPSTQDFEHTDLLEVLKDILNYDGLLIHEDRFNRAVAAVRKAEGRL